MGTPGAGAVVKGRCGGVYLKVLQGSHWAVVRLKMHFEGVRRDRMMDRVRIEEGRLLGTLAEGSTVIRIEQMEKAWILSIVHLSEAALRVLQDPFKVLLFMFSSH